MIYDYDSVLRLHEIASKIPSALVPQNHTHAIIFINNALKKC